MNKLITLSLLLASILLAACGSGEVVVAQEPGLDTTDMTALDGGPPTTEDVVRPDLVDGVVLVVEES